MARRKEINDMTLEVLEGLGGTAAVNDTLSVSDTYVEIDTVSLTPTGQKIIFVGCRFTTAGIATVRTVTATQNSQQWTLDLTASSGGTFDLTLNGETASSIAYNASSATIQTAIEGLASMSSGDVTVTGDDPHTITLAGDFANTSGNTMTVDGGSLTAADSEVFTEVQDGLTTWALTFSPAIATGSVPSDSDVITVYPRKLEIQISDEGDVDWSKNKDPQITRSRGAIDGAKTGDEQEMEVNFSFILDWIRSTTTDVPTVDEVLEREGEAADWVNAARDECEAYQVTLKLIDAPDCGSEQAEIMIFPYFIPTTNNPSVDAGAVSISGICATTKPIARRVTNDSDTIEITNS